MHFRSFKLPPNVGHFRSLRPRMVAKVLSQAYYQFAALSPKPGSLSRTVPPGAERILGKAVSSKNSVVSLRDRIACDGCALAPARRRPSCSFLRRATALRPETTLSPSDLEDGREDPRAAPPEWLARAGAKCTPPWRQRQVSLGQTMVKYSDRNISYVLREGTYNTG